MSKVLINNNQGFYGSGPVVRDAISEDVERAEIAAGEAEASASASASSASAAATSETNAASSASTAATSEANAATSATNASDSADSSDSSAQAAASAATDADAYESLAQEWAENDEWVPISTDPGKYSAKHWALQSQATGQLQNADEVPINPIAGMDPAATEVQAALQDLQDSKIGSGVTAPDSDKLGGVLPAGYVDTTNNQTVAGEKTFSNTIACNSSITAPFFTVEPTGSFSHQGGVLSQSDGSCIISFAAPIQLNGGISQGNHAVNVDWVQANTLDADSSVTWTGHHVLQQSSIGSGGGTWDVSVDQSAALLLGSDDTLTLSGGIAGGVYTLVVNNVGSFTLTLANASWAGGSSPTITPSGTDIITVYYDGTNYLATIVQDFK